MNSELGKTDWNSTYGPDRSVFAVENSFENPYIGHHIPTDVASREDTVSG